MQFKVQYWLKANLIDTPSTEEVFLNVGDLRNWMKPKLNTGFFDSYQWTILLDRSDTGEGHFTVLHSEMNTDDILDNMSKITSYDKWVRGFTIQLRQMLGIL